MDWPNSNETKSASPFSLVAVTPVTVMPTPNEREQLKAFNEGGPSPGRERRKAVDDGPPPKSPSTQSTVEYRGCRHIPSATRKCSS